LPAGGRFGFPSLYEGFGMPLVEAMHLRKPIICGSAGSVAEVVGEAGISVNPRNPAALS
jgi:glycosyltransferase involved in cell wall biosynthesis